MTDNDERIAAARRAERRATVRIVFWTINVAIVGVLYFAARSVWEEVSILYLALVSIIALIEGAYSSRAAKRAERRALEERG